MRQAQEARCTSETRNRASQLPTGLKALWFRVTGRYRKLLTANEAAFEANETRDRVERQVMIESQLRERRALRHEKLEMCHRHEVMAEAMRRDIAQWRMGLGVVSETLSDSDEETAPRHRRRKSRNRSP